MSKFLSNKLIIINFVLSTMIISYHAYNIPVYESSLKGAFLGKIIIFLENYLSMMERVAVPLFFVISGYLFFQNYNKSMALKKIKSRIISLGIPYIIWNAISWSLYAVLTNIVPFKNIVNMPKVKIEILTAMCEIFLGKYNALWFVRVLLFFIVVSPLIYFVIRKEKRGILFLIVIILIEGLCKGGEFSLLYCSLFYFFGAVVALNFKNLVLYRVKNIYSIISMIVFCLLNFAIYSSFKDCPFIIRQIFLLINCILFWISFDLFLQTKVSKFMEKQWWVGISFFIYCSHGFILECMEKIILLLLKNSLFGAIVDYVVAPTLTLFIIFIVAFSLQKYCFSLWNILVGGRSKYDRQKKII